MHAVSQSFSHCLRYLQVVTAVSVAIISATCLFVVAKLGLEVGVVRHTGIHSRYHRKILREKKTRFFQSKLVFLAQSPLLYGIFYKKNIHRIPHVQTCSWEFIKAFSEIKNY